MAKVHPQAPLAASISSKQQTFTIWMKSLVMNSYGCTVFDSNGELVYRVDNYDHKCGGQVYLMDTRGKVLFAIEKKKFKLMGQWDGYSSSCRDVKPQFQVRQTFELSRGYSTYKVALALDTNQPFQYRMESRSAKSACKIVDNVGDLVAEVKRKISASGIDLGEDVLTMVVEPHIDHSLIMGLIVVHSLINRKM